MMLQNDGTEERERDRQIEIGGDQREIETGRQTDRQTDRQKDDGCYNNSQRAIHVCRQRKVGKSSALYQTCVTSKNQGLGEGRSWIELV